MAISEKVRVRVPQEDGQITGSWDGDSRRWIVVDHIAEVDEAELNRFLSGVSGATVARDQQATSKPDEAKAKDGK